MATSPFGKPNAVLTFYLEIPGEMETNEFGDPIPKKVPKKVYAKLDGRTPKVDRPPGIDVSAVYLDGRAINPMVLPKSLVGTLSPRLAEAKVNDISGTFLFQPVLRSSYALESALGDVVSGWFTVGAKLP